jgi:hypothetical protein
MKDFLEYGNVMSDGIIPGSYKIINFIKKSSANPIFLTGRNDCGRKVTEDWLKLKFNFENIPLYMRPEEMIMTASHVYKEIMFLKIKDTLPENSKFLFFEDQERIIQMFKK